MWTVTPATHDKYGNALIGLSKQERQTIKNAQEKEAAKQGVFSMPRMSHKAIRALVRGGLPGAQRMDLWMQLSGAEELRRSYPIEYFESLTQRYLSPRLIHDVELCVMKWMPSQKLLTSQTGLQTVAKIVQAYCKYVGSKPEESFYTIAAFLVTVKGDKSLEDCFWLLTAFLHKNGGQDEPGFRGHTESHVLAALCEKRLPKLCAHLDLISFSLARETTHWFANGFIGILPALTVVRVWDVAMYEGPKVFYRVALALLKRSDIQSLSWVSMMSWRVSRTFDADALMKAAFKGLGSFSASDIQEVQSLCSQQSRLLQTNCSRRLEALLCPAERTLQSSSTESIE